MKWLSTVIVLCAAYCLVVLPPGSALAQAISASGLVITQVQTGAKTASDELVVLYNPLEQAVVISGWQVRFQNDDSTSTTLLATVPEGAVVSPRQTYTLHTASVPLTAGMTGQVYRAGLSNKDKVVALFVQNPANCTLQADTAVRWQEVAQTPQLRTYATADSIVPAFTPVKQADCTPQLASKPGVSTPTVAVRITELLPNPAAPGTDAADEFIELFNSADQVASLAGYTLVSGLKGTYRYSIPEDSTVPARGFVTLYASVTHLALANSGGQVRLLDPQGVEISQTAAYVVAADAQAWAYIDGGWQWTSNPSPNADNTASPPAIPPPVAVKKLATAAASKTSVVKSAAKSSVASSKTAKAPASKTPKPATAKNSTAPAAPIATAGAASSPLHPGVLAIVGGLALLYGLYEYRHDLANKIHQFRTNRAIRRAAGQNVEGRRDN